jgi:hypothetical protein
MFCGSSTIFVGKPLVNPHYSLTCDGSLKVAFERKLKGCCKMTFCMGDTKRGDEGGFAASIPSLHSKVLPVIPSNSEESV